MKKMLLAAISALGLLAILNAQPAMAQGVSPNQMFGCNQSAIYDASTAGATKLVTGVSNKRIYVCGWNILSGGTVNVSLIYGTGGTCGSGTTSITPAFQLTAQISEVDHLPVYTGIAAVPASNDLCINASGGVAVQAIVYYTLF